MTSGDKAEAFYSQSAYFKKQGNLFLAEKMEKIADHFGRIFIKEALYASKKLKKTAVIEKPERSSTPHSGLKKRLLKQRKKESADWSKAWNVIKPHLKNVGTGAAYTAGGLAVAAPVASYALDEATDSTMDKIKEYAVPGALAVAGLAAGAYGLGQRAQAPAPQSRRRALVKRPLPRRKMAELIAGFKTREKLAKASGENSKIVKDCDTAISRLLFGA
tara:strand:+ start:1365 stop:2018 length:654 start_codon:yes stop_codon:yes gene_type:complete